jgi:hypothetical protein
MFLFSVLAAMIDLRIQVPHSEDNGFTTARRKVKAVKICKYSGNQVPEGGSSANS